MLKVNFFGCGELGHYVNQCPKWKKDKKGKQTSASIKIKDLSARLEVEFTMIVAVSP